MAEAGQTAGGAKRGPDGVNLTNMMGGLQREVDIDPAVLAKEIGTASGGLEKPRRAIRHSATTLERSKTITNYIAKLHGDIRMLTGVQENLDAITVHLEKEKVDTYNAEKISKDSLSAFRDMVDNGALGDLFNGMTQKDSTNQEGDVPKFREPQPDRSTDKNTKEEPNTSSTFEEEADPTFLDTLRDGLNEPDLVPIDSDMEDDFIDLTF